VILFLLVFKPSFAYNGINEKEVGKMIHAYFFDLDGTLLPLDEDHFIELYMKLIGQKFAALGFEPKQMIDRLWAGTKAMVMNDGSATNEKVFWDIFHPETEGREDLKEALVGFYNHEFQHVMDSVSQSPYAKKIIQWLKANEKEIFLLTNPIFPFVATKNRIRWAGLHEDDFKHITTYENAHYAKPNIKYYQEILKQFDLAPDQVMMVGNDVDEDMIVETLGMDTYLITDCIKNKNNQDIQSFKQGSLKDFYEFLRQED
jgi:FMN phosphatase YigB (HAD superfamily)